MALTNHSLSGSIRAMKHSLRQQKGGASLLVTIVFALLLLGVVGGLATLSVRELRQASNTEQSNRALTAAESFVEKQANLLVTADDPQSLYKDTCQKADIGTEADNLEITCYTVSAGKGDSAEKSLARDQSFKLELKGLAVASMSIEWETKGRKVGTFYPTDGWPAGMEGEAAVPAALETSFVWWNGSSITPLNDPNGDFGLPLMRYVTKPGRTTGPIATECSNDAAYAGGYYCRTSSNVQLQQVTGQPTVGNLVVKVTPRYSSANIRLKFFDAAGKQLEIPLPYATIDVTARANNLYKRVVATKDLDPSSSFSFLDGNVLFSGENICKDLIVGADSKPVNGGNGKNNLACENPAPSPE